MIAEFDGNLTCRRTETVTEVHHQGKFRGPDFAPMHFTLEGATTARLSRAFRKFMRRHRLPQIRLHDLRHSHATHLLAAGVHPKIAQERLGHSSVGITLDLYSHVLPGMQEDAVAKVDAALQAAINKRETSASKALAKPDFRSSGEKEKL